VPLLSGYQILKAMDAIVAERFKWHSDFFRFDDENDILGKSDLIPALRNNEV
jgi:hypothetical protein